MQRFSTLLKLDPFHDAKGRFTTGSSSQPPDLRITHSSRYDEVIESKISARTDLGYFRGKTPRSFSSPMELDNNATWHGSEDALIAKLEPKEYKALKSYTGSGVYSILNKDMAAGKTRDPETLEIAKTIYGALKKSEIPEDVTLFRGMRARGVLLEGDAAIGKVYSDKVFKSTSLGDFSPLFQPLAIIFRFSVLF